MPAGAAGSRRTTFAGDDAIERQIPELEDLAHAAGAEPLDGLKPLELRQRRAASAPARDRPAPTPPSSAAVIDR